MQVNEPGVDENRDPFGKALASIRTRLRAGGCVMGEQLMITELSRGLKLSATPVREALSRLAGEGLIEDRRGMGYFAWRLDAVELAELYDLQMVYLAAALRRATDPTILELRRANGVADAPTVTNRPLSDLDRTEALFQRIIIGARSLALSRANKMLADRLAPARRVEAYAVPLGAGDEIGDLERQVDGGASDAIEDALAGYHFLRTRHAPAIIAALRSAGPGIGGI